MHFKFVTKINMQKIFHYICKILFFDNRYRQKRYKAYGTKTTKIF